MHERISKQLEVQLGFTQQLPLALILSLFNVFIHSRDGYTSVVPTGLILSTLVVLILLVTGWNGWAMVYRHRVGVSGETP